MSIVLRNSPRDYFKHRKCAKNGGHEYEEYCVSIIDGARKLHEYRCVKCGHERADIV